MAGPTFKLRLDWPFAVPRLSMLPPHSRGLLMALFSVVMISPDALLLIEMASFTPPAAVLFWKCIAVSSLSLLHACCKFGNPANVSSALRSLPLHSILGVCALQALSVSGFALSVLLTTPARAMLFIALNPVWASLIGVSVLGEPLPRRMLITLLLSLGCVGVMCSESLQAHVTHSVGDAVALCTGGVFALYLTALRLTAQQHASVDLTILSSGGFLLAAAAVLATTPLHHARSASQCPQSPQCAVLRG